jgi:ribosomal protein S18 acetylase RimI-like enzyme
MTGFERGIVANRWQGLADPSVKHLIRVATVADAAAVRALDDAGFPAGNRDQQRAADGELEAAVLAGDVWILELGAEPLAYIHADRSRADRIYISGLAVSPRAQRMGLGSRLVDDFMGRLSDDLRARLPIVTITSPRNLVMLRLIFARGFRARWILRNYFGPGRDRLGCQLTSAGYRAPPDRVLTMPVAALDTVYRFVEVHRHVIQGLSGVAGDARFELARYPGQQFPPSAPPEAIALP